MLSRRSRLYIFFLAVVLASMMGAVLFISLLDYDLLVTTVTSVIQKNGLEDKIRNSLFTRSRFVIVQRVAWLVFFIGPVCFWLAIKYRKLVYNCCKLMVSSVNYAARTTIKVFSDNSSKQNIPFFSLMAGVLCFYSWRMVHSYPTYDEMWSYNYYTVNPFYYSFFTYSSYPFFELSTQFFKCLPFPMMFNLRLSSFVFGIATVILLYACLRKYCNNHTVAMATVFAFAFMPVTIIFMVSARGVAHELFFATAGLFSLLGWLEKPHRREYLVIYIIAGTLGLYSMTTHLYFLAFLFVFTTYWLVKKNKPAWLVFLKANILVSILFLALYTPILLVTGLSVYKDVLVHSPSYLEMLNRMPSGIYQVIEVYAGGNWLNISGYIIAPLVLLLLKHKMPLRLQLLFVVAAGLPVTVFIFYFVTRFDYPARAVAFGSLSIPLYSCLFASLILPVKTSQSKRLVRSIVLTAGLVIFLLAGYLSIPSRPVYKSIAEMSKILMENNIQTCYDNSSEASGFYVYYPGLEYYYRIRHKKIKLTLSASNSMRYKPLLPGDRYDCIVYNINETDNFRTGYFHEIYRDPEGKFKVLKRNDLPSN